MALDYKDKYILLLEDDVAMLNVTETRLSAISPRTYKYLKAGNVQEAFNILNKTPIDLIILDLNMPGVNGMQFLFLIGRKYPKLRKIVFSGQDPREYWPKCKDLGADVFIEKGDRNAFKQLIENVMRLTEDASRPKTKHFVRKPETEALPGKTPTVPGMGGAAAARQPIPPPARPHLNAEPKRPYPPLTPSGQSENKRPFPPIPPRDINPVPQPTHNRPFPPLERSNPSPNIPSPAAGRKNPVEPVEAHSPILPPPVFITPPSIEPQAPQEPMDEPVMEEIPEQIFQQQHIPEPVAEEPEAIAVQPVPELEESIHEDAGFEGVMRQKGLVDIVQIECLSGSTSVITITRGREKGRIYFDRGNVVHAETNTLKGEQAIFSMLSWKSGKFEYSNLETVPEQTIFSSWQAVLLEAARLSDELAGESAETQSNPTPPKPTPPPAQEDEDLGEWTGVNFN